MRAADYLDNANVWAVLDLIVAEFKSDPRSVACFDGRLVRRAIALNDEWLAARRSLNARVLQELEQLSGDRDALVLALAILSLDRPGWRDYLRGLAVVVAGDAGGPSFDSFRRLNADRWKERPLL